MGKVMAKKIAVIDGNSLMHRAYHAVPPTMTAPDGTPTNAVFGFISMFLKLYETVKPDAVVCAFDKGRPQFRIDALKQYKAQRPPMDTDLKVQFPVMERVLDSMNIPVVSIQGWEGDDILGTIARMDEELGYETILVTGDKDAYQLVTDSTQVLTTKRGITDITIYGPAEVEERYGVTPAQFVDFLGLKGDTADNIPGVKGIGDKSAAKLLSTFGSIDGIYENLDKLKGKQLENLQAYKEDAYLSRQVAQIMTNAPVEVDLEAAAFPHFDNEYVSEVFHEFRFNAHLTKVLSLAGVEDSSDFIPSLDLPNPKPIKGKEAWDALEVALEGKVMLGVDFLVPLQTTLFEEPKCLFVAAGDDVLLFEAEDSKAAFVRIVKDGVFCTLDVKKALQEIYPADTAEEAQAMVDDLLAADFFDIGLAAYLLNSNITHYTYDVLCDTYLQCALPVAENEQEDAVINALVAPRLAEVLTSALKDDGCFDCYRDIDVPLVVTLALMERVGAALDAERLSVIGAETEGMIETIRTQIYDLAGETFNIDSPKQLGHILFEVLELPVGKKNQRGYSTDAKTLKGLQDKHEIAGLVLRYRELAKMKSTYIDALPRMRAHDNRIHTSFNQTITTTGRLSSSDPNLQNIPVRTAFGRQIRECFIPLQEDHVFVSADYSQIELRLLAHLSGDEHLINAFCSGADFHASTAARVFGVSVEDVTPELRSHAKAVNFGIVYGQQAYGLAQSLGIGYREAQGMIDRYFDAYPGVRVYLDKTIEEAKECGYAVTMFGRKRHIPELKSSNAATRGFGERTAMNHPMQGSAADIIKLAMNEVQQRLIRENFEAQLLLQVHDELDFSVPVGELDALSKMVSDVMSHIVELRVPLLVDVSQGKNWAEAH